MDLITTDIKKRAKSGELLAKALFFDDVRNGKTAFKAILIRGVHRADKENTGR